MIQVPKFPTPQQTEKGIIQLSGNIHVKSLNNTAPPKGRFIRELKVENYQEALNRIPPPGAGCHGALLGAANLGIIAGLSDGQIHEDLRRSIPAGDRRVSDKEIMDAIVKARREITPHSAGGPYHPAPRPAPRPLIDGDATRRKLITAGDGATDADIWELSPIRPDWEPGYQDALAVLSLYSADEHLYLGSQYDTTVKPVSVWREEIEHRQEAIWPHIMPNPIDGDAHDLGDGKTSFRCDAAVSAFRYAVVEFDNLSKPEQFAFWYSILSKKLLDVALLLDSGGKSIHAWIRVSLADRDAWNREVCIRFYGPTGVMTALGADRACRNPSRLSRLAGHYRAEKSNWQTLLYLNGGTL
jgi:hypothetical protein